MDETPSIDALLDNATWLRSLARGMLADHGFAEDALQETWIVALRDRPVPGSERPWLARVLRNFVLARKRSEAARSSREERGARSERLPGADETVARAELHARLIQAVLALEEPYRATILWRYFEGLDDDEIARRARIEPATVRSRLARAREKLRASLIASGGDEPERWLMALLPLGARVEQIPTGVTAGVLATLGGSLMKAKLIVSTVSIALLALWLARGSTTEPGLAQVGASAPPLARRRAGSGSSSETQRARAPFGSPFCGAVRARDERRGVGDADVDRHRSQRGRTRADRRRAHRLPARLGDRAVHAGGS